MQKNPKISHLYGNIIYLQFRLQIYFVYWFFLAYFKFCYYSTPIIPILSKEQNVIWRYYDPPYFIPSLIFEFLFSTCLYILSFTITGWMAYRFMGILNGGVELIYVLFCISIHTSSYPTSEKKYIQNK